MPECMMPDICMFIPTVHFSTAVLIVCLRYSSSSSDIEC